MHLDPSFVDGLFKAGALIHMPGSDRSALHEAIFIPLTEPLEQLLNHDPSDVNALDVDRETPLSLAIQYNHVNHARILLNHGASLHPPKNCRHPSYFLTVNSQAMAECLLSFGAQKVLDEQENTFLHYAKTVDVAKACIEEGANVYAKNNNGWTPFHFAVTMASPERAALVLYFLERGVDPNFSSVEQLSSLMVTNDPEVVKILLQHGADPNLQHSSGNTALHIHAHTPHIESLLLEAGADVFIKNHQGDLPIGRGAHQQRTMQKP